MTDMDLLGVILGIANVSVALLGIGVSIPLLRGKIKPNAWYGFRFPESFASDQAWVTINRYGAKRLIFWSIVVLAVGSATFFVRLGANLPAIFAISLAPLLTCVSGIESWRFAKQYASRQKASGP